MQIKKQTDNIVPDLFIFIIEIALYLGVVGYANYKRCHTKIQDLGEEFWLHVALFLLPMNLIHKTSQPTNIISGLSHSRDLDHWYLSSLGP